MTTKLVVEIYARKDCTLCRVSHSKPACVLCGEARDIISRVNSEVPFLYREVDIGLNDDLGRRYRDEIPTVFINGKKAFKFKVDESEFRKKVRKEHIKDGIMRLWSKKQRYDS
ncbi:MAG: glutaredoxin family protein [Deltaproteobacteria bacterium]|nr:glutaredoxin family protein [Deltaproteobacteria bacterium]